MNATAIYTPYLLKNFNPRRNAEHNKIYQLIILESMPRLKLSKKILNFNLYLLLISSQSESLKLASSLPSSQPKLLLAYYLRILKCRTKYRTEEINNLASRYLANKTDWYQRHIVHQHTQAKPHPHLGLQRLQHLNAIHNLQSHKANHKLNTATHIYFKRYDKKVSATASCRPAVHSKTPHSVRSTAASGPTRQTSQGSPTSPVSIRIQTMHPSPSCLSL